MVGPKKQNFCPRINMLKEFFLNNPTMKYGSSKSAKIVCTFKVNFLCQKLTDFFSKIKIHLRISIQETTFCKKHFF